MLIKFFIPSIFLKEIWSSNIIIWNLFKNAGEIWEILSKLDVDIILKFLWIFNFGLLEFSWTSKYFSSLLFFLSNNPFNLSITLEGASLILSKTMQFPFFIELYKNPGSNINSSLPYLFSNFCVPINSVYSKFFVH